MSEPVFKSQHYKHWHRLHRY